jgi:hypothetical protein
LKRSSSRSRREANAQGFRSVPGIAPDATGRGARSAIMPLPRGLTPLRGKRQVEYIDWFVCGSVLCAVGALALFALRASRAIRLAWSAAVLVCTALAWASWLCLWVAAKINASV